MHRRHSKFILVGGIGLIILLMSAGGIFGIYATKHMEQINIDFYQKPYSTNIHVRNIESSFRSIKNRIHDIQIVDDIPEFDSMEFRLKYYCKAMKTQLENLRLSCRCDQPHTEELARLFQQWLPIRDEIIQSVKTNIANEPLEITREKGARHVKKITASLDKLIEFANKKAFDFVKAHEASDKNQDPTDILEKFYRHPYAVSNAVRQIQAGTIAIHRDMKDVATAPDLIQLNILVENIDEQEQVILKSFALVKKQFLGDQAQVQDAEKLFRQWRSIRQVVIDRRTKQLNADYKLISEKNQTHYWLR